MKLLVFAMNDVWKFFVIFLPIFLKGQIFHITPFSFTNFFHHFFTENKRYSTFPNSQNEFFLYSSSGLNFEHQLLISEVALESLGGSSFKEFKFIDERDFGRMEMQSNELNLMKKRITAQHLSFRSFLDICKKLFESEKNLKKPLRNFGKFR